MEVYDNPRYYEIAFSFRDIPKEIDFLEQLIAKESKISVKTFLEIASGNSPHMQELCRRGYGYIGLELNKQMVEYARNKIKSSALTAEIIEGDLLKFSLPKLVDCVLLFLGSLYVKSDDELLSHLDSVARALRSGGLYVLDGAVNFYPGDKRLQSWNMEEGGIKVTTTYRPEWIDRGAGITRSIITLDIEEEGKKKRIEHSEMEKTYSVDEFISIVQRSGQWESAGSFCDFNISGKPQKEKRNILVIRRK